MGKTGEFGPLAFGAVGEDAVENLLLVGCQIRLSLNDMDEMSRESANRHTRGGEAGEQFLKTERRESGRAAQNQHGQRPERPRLNWLGQAGDALLHVFPAENPKMR